MLRVMVALFTIHCSLFTVNAQNNRTYNQMTEDGSITTRTDNSRNFSSHNNDTTKKHKEIPKGIYVWTIDKTLGDVIPAEPDTLPHLFPNTTFNTGIYGDYNTTGSNYTARLSRILIDREPMSYFIFTEPYSFVNKQADKFLFMNTLSPYTSILYDDCGDKVDGEDHIDAKFAVNAGKRFNVGFDLDYAYARGYFSNQNISHFNATIFSSYLGDKYQMHFFFNSAHQKAAENGGLVSDEYVTHPESFQQSFNDNEIPTVLEKNWNRNDHQHALFTHRYNLGFYRWVKMTEAELKARKFAEESKKEHEENAQNDQNKDNQKGPSRRNDTKRKEVKAPSGRPEGAKVMGKEPARDSLAVAANDSTRIKVDGQAAIDSLNRLKAIEDSIKATMKREFVPVTSFIHTFEWNNYGRIYQAYNTPKNYYKDTYYTQGTEYGNDSIYDEVKHMQLKNTFGLGLLEGFNKYVKAGLKAYLSIDHCEYQLPDINDVGLVRMNKWTENDFAVGGVLSKTQGRTLHFNVGAEYTFSGPNAGNMSLDFSTDLNFALFGDSVQLAASAFLHRINPGFFVTSFHSKHFWWDADFQRETHSRIEGLFSYEKTNTMLRVALDAYKDYAYFGMSYDMVSDGTTSTYTGRENMTAQMYQESEAISVLTAQLHQNFRLGPLNWENVITYQNSSKQSVLPLPTWNIFTNLYLKFRIAKVLGVELGTDVTYFSKYYAPDFCPGINQFAVQMNDESKVELGGYPFMDVYANLALKGVRFFLVMSNVLNGSGNHMKFLTPHYPTNGSVIRFGVSWPFFN